MAKGGRTGQRDRGSQVRHFVLKLPLVRCWNRGENSQVLNRSWNRVWDVEIEVSCVFLAI